MLFAISFVILTELKYFCLQFTSSLISTSFVNEEVEGNFLCFSILISF